MRYHRIRSAGWDDCLFAFSHSYSQLFAESIVCRIGVLSALIPIWLDDCNYSIDVLSIRQKIMVLARSYKKNNTTHSQTHTYTRMYIANMYKNTIHNLIASSIRIVRNWFETYKKVIQNAHPFENSIKEIKLLFKLTISNEKWLCMPRCSGDCVRCLGSFFR